MSPLLFRVLGEYPAEASRRIVVIGIILAASLLAGCGKKKLPEQTIVTGDKFEITLPELEQILRAAPAVTREEVAPARRALLDALIGQKLLAEAGDEQHLGERPDVVQQLAATRRAILANAYIAKIANDEEKISDRDVARYYDKHSGLFKDRLTFTVDEVALPLQTPDLLSYTRLLDDRGFDAFKIILAQRIPGAMIVTRKLSSSDLPAEADRAATALKPGSDISYSTGSALHLGRVVAVQPAPISLDEARARIAAMLAQERRVALTNAAVDDLKRTRHVRIVNADLSKMVAQ